jgi:peptidoglycan/xylan/chitin deacetylase (PgdA/CDA1 family)
LRLLLVLLELSGALDAARESASHRRAPAPAARLSGDSTLWVDGNDAPRNYVTFTFDDGPTWAATPRVLDALAAHDLRATFFVCGYQFQGKKEKHRKNLELLRKIAAAGHVIGNHTHDHASLATLDFRAAIAQITRNDQALYDALGFRPRIFRAPYGLVPDAVRQYLRDVGYTTVRWNIDVMDFELNDAKEITRRVLDTVRARRGGIVVLHDVKYASVKAVPMILDGLRADNCKRLAAGKEPILPVELDFFLMQADGLPVPVPAEVATRAAETRKKLEEFCASRKKVARRK